ncbi:MAG: histidine phosphatase family protein [Phycisphaerae bacterium]
MLVYAIRHAESLSNVRQAEGLNAGLTELGRRQAAALADRLRAAGLAAVYSSPFARCIESAMPLAEALGLPIRVRADLCEHHHLPPGTRVDLGLEPMEHLGRRHPLVISCEDQQESPGWVPADETFSALVARMRRFAAFLKTRWTGEDEVVAVFSHGSPIARFIEAWLTDEAGPSFRFIIDNGTIAALRHLGGVSTLVCLNEASHLRGLPVPAAANFAADGTIRRSTGADGW